MLSRKLREFTQLFVESDVVGADEGWRKSLRDAPAGLSLDKSSSISLASSTGNCSFFGCHRFCWPIRFLIAFVFRGDPSLIEYSAFDPLS